MAYSKRLEGLKDLKLPSILASKPSSFLTTSYVLSAMSYLPDALRLRPEPESEYEPKECKTCASNINVRAVLAGFDLPIRVKPMSCLLNRPKNYRIWSGIFEMSPKQLRQKSPNIPDDFSCQLTVLKAGKRKTLTFNELGAPENLRRLSAHLRKLALKKKEP